jgi:hypothetical protein
LIGAAGGVSSATITAASSVTVAAASSSLVATGEYATETEASSSPATYSSVEWHLFHLHTLAAASSVASVLSAYFTAAASSVAWHLFHPIQ